MWHARSTLPQAHYPLNTGISCVSIEVIKVCGSLVASLLNCTPKLEWYMAKLLVKTCVMVRLDYGLRMQTCVMVRSDYGLKMQSSLQV